MLEYGAVEESESGDITISAVSTTSLKLSVDFRLRTSVSCFCLGWRFARLSGERPRLAAIVVEFCRPWSVLFGDFEVDEKDALRLKPDVLLGCEWVDSLWVDGDPLLVLGLVDVGVLLLPNMLAPFENSPLLLCEDDGCVRCIVS